MIFSRGIRGAITVDSDSSEAIRNAAIELLTELTKLNSLNKNDISHVIFSLTKDLTSDFPAKYARLELGWDSVPMLCFNEADINNALKFCLRVLIVVNTKKTQDEIIHVYLKDAKKLRPDISH